MLVENTLVEEGSVSEGTDELSLAAFPEEPDEAGVTEFDCEPGTNEQPASKEADARARRIREGDCFFITITCLSIAFYHRFFNFKLNLTKGF